MNLSDTSNKHFWSHKQFTHVLPFNKGYWIVIENLMHYIKLFH